MLKAFFKLIPNEIEEAAYIDGASRYIVISRIIVPLAAPGIASVSIFCFIISWTEYLFASILISGDDECMSGDSFESDIDLNNVKVIGVEGGNYCK